KKAASARVQAASAAASPRPQGRRSKNAPGSSADPDPGFPLDTLRASPAGQSYGTTTSRRSSSAGSRPSATQTVVNAGCQSIALAERTLSGRPPGTSAAGRDADADSSLGRRISILPRPGPSPPDQPGNRLGYIEYGMPTIRFPDRNDSR